jgi:hypothetical protein
MLAACAVSMTLALTDVCDAPNCPTFPPRVIVEAKATTINILGHGGFCVRFVSGKADALIGLFNRRGSDPSMLGFEHEEHGKFSGVITLYGPTLRDYAKNDTELSAVMSSVLTHELLHAIGCEHTTTGLMREVRPARDMAQGDPASDIEDVKACVRSVTK